MKFTGSAEELLHLEHVDHTNCNVLSETPESSLSVIWFYSNDNRLIIDGVEHCFHKNQVVFLTEFHQVEIRYVDQIRLLRFNRPFYCILDHDNEVSCRGLLFFGASQLPIIQIPEKEVETFEILWKMFSIEMESDDNLQIDMLQTMLKRYLILCTRIYKQQANLEDKEEELDVIRTFNFLVEKHFKSMHTVAEYADLLHKSPKTLSNLFSKLSGKSPLQFIQERRMLEAKRLLRYSDMQVKEVAYHLGYEDLQTFSRFFKKKEGQAPSEYKKTGVRKNG